MANFQSVKAITLKKEAGLSRATTDTASRNPSPYVYQGKTGWHTNKGVTYTTFVEASKRYGFENNANNFLTMPEAIWDKIAKGMYWDFLRLDTLKSDGVAIQLFSLVWGGLSWYNAMQRYLSSKGISWNKNPSTLASAVNTLIDKQGERKTIEELDVVQQDYYKSLNQPANTRGWVNRVKETTQYAYNYIGNVVKEVAQNKNVVNYALLGVGIILVASASYYIYKKNV